MSHHVRGGQSTARPTLQLFFPALSLSSLHGFACPQKTAARYPQWVAEGSRFFITIKCAPPDKNQFCRADIGDDVLAAVAHNHNKLVCHCHLCLLMPDHLHAIMAFPREPGMKIVVTNWKKFVAVKHGIEWQRDFFDHRLRNQGELEKKTSYILMYPVRKGLCERMEDWIWVYRPNDRPPPMLGY